MSKIKLVIKWEPANISHVCLALSAVSAGVVASGHAF